MPETIRTANERLRSRPRRGGFLAAFVLAALCIARHAGARRHGPHRPLYRRRRNGKPRPDCRCHHDTRSALLRRAGHRRRCCARAKPPPWRNPRRRTKPWRCAPKSTGSRRCCCRSRRCWWPGRPARDEPEIIGDTGMVVSGARAGARARLRRLAGAGGGATHGARGRHAAPRGPRLRDDAHHQRRPAARGGRARGRRGARCCACATSAASSAS